MNSDEIPETTQFTPPETTIQEGIYIIANRSTRMQLDLTHGREEEGAFVKLWSSIENSTSTQQSWLISPANDQSFVLRNIGTGKVLDFEGNGEVGKRLVCRSRTEDSARQEWRLEHEEEDFYSIRNSQFTDKALEVRPWGEVPNPPLDVVSGGHIGGTHDQQWTIERRSFAVSEVIEVVGACPILQEMPITWPSAEVRGMLGIKGGWRDRLIKESGLMLQVPRTGLLDHKTFAMKLKETVQSDCIRRVKIDGYAILFGVVGGSSNIGSKAYNWYLTDDLCEIVFLNPLNGHELTAKGLQKKGFRAEWAIC